jgi:hypothetical protein
METAGDQSVKCVQSHKNSLCIENPSLTFCNESRLKSVQIESDEYVSLVGSKFPSYMHVICNYSIDVHECRMCDVSERVFVSDENDKVSSQNLSDENMKVSSRNLYPPLPKRNVKVDVNVSRYLCHDKCAQTVESCTNPFFLEVYRSMNPCHVKF